MEQVKSNQLRLSLRDVHMWRMTGASKMHLQAKQVDVDAVVNRKVVQPCLAVLLAVETPKYLHQHSYD